MEGENLLLVKYDRHLSYKLPGGGQSIIVSKDNKLLYSLTWNGSRFDLKR